MTNPFSSRAAQLSGPAFDYVPVPDGADSDLPSVAIGLYVETAGTVRFESAAGQIRDVAVPDFGWILCGAKRVLTAGTTALGIHALTLS